MKKLLTIFFLIVFGNYCNTEVAMKFELISPAFENEGMIPVRYTCDGENVSPPLKWNNIPEGAKSLALINDDPDAPAGDWIHWILYNIPPEIDYLPEGASNKKQIPPNSVEGLNDWGLNSYGGPCPPSGIHRYYFKLYALDTVLTADDKMTKKKLLGLMKGHILGEAVLMGKYKRAR
ncbi:putative phosphatidylethanolamine-binding protein [Melioribacter roseus P3M-2]|uniref:Putative phosphatidylethanolamine-binding protein n=2 Tax=Melioribacter roseus TaxID=1134405 RepID=I6Z5I2_MELRP|nr:putative phosphatidylethanolamine-binding protein [Melioribacter roseus P3M-2]